MPADGADVVLGMWRALSNRDWAAMKPYLAEDCIYVDMPIGPAAAAWARRHRQAAAGGLEPLADYVNP